MPRPSATARTRIAVILTLSLATAIVVLALIPLPAAPPVPGSDKTHHFIAFGTLVLPAALLAPRALWWVVPLAVIEAGLIEIVQPHVNRLREWADFTAGLWGVAAGTIAGLALHGIARGAMGAIESSRSQNRL